MPPMPRIRKSSVPGKLLKKKHNIKLTDRREANEYSSREIVDRPINSTKAAKKSSVIHERESIGRKKIEDTDPESNTITTKFY